MPAKDNLREKLLADEDVQGTPPPRRNGGVAEVELVASSPLPVTATVQEAAEEDSADGVGLANVQFFRPDTIGYVTSWLVSMMTGGIMLLFFRWMPIMHLRWTHRLCEAWDGTRVLATGLDGTQTIVEIETVIEPGGGVERRTFVYRLVRYFEGPGGEFVPSLFEAKVGYSVLLKGAATGLSEAEVARNKFYFGKNLADVPVKDYFSLLVDEILHPFYIFQVWSVVVWYLEPYIMYATAIAVISLVSALVSLFSARRNLENIRHMAHFVCPITVRRRIGSESAPPQCIEIDSTDLVPGDIVELSDNVVFPCDLVLCSGTCIVNESMLTGESLPVLKTSVPVHVGVGQEGTYSPSQDKRFTLFCGTKCMEARKQGKASPVLAMVLRTGFSTAKGKLVRSILFPKPASFKMYADSFKFVGVMAVMATAGFCFSIHTFVKYNVDLWEIILNACDVVTIAVPPALPAAMTIGTEFALERLKKAKIFCISPNRVNVCGELDMICFDKTGTLTEEGVDVMGVMSVNESVQLSPLQAVENATLGLQRCLATCHGLTSVGGELVGDPLDLKMFEATQWSLEEPEVKDSETSVIPPIVYPPADLAHPHFLHAMKQFGLTSLPTVSENRLTTPTSPNSPTKSIVGSLPGSLPGSLRSPTLRSAHSPTEDPGSMELSELKWGETNKATSSSGAAARKGNSEKRFGIAITRRFDFTSVHQRMSVVTRAENTRGSHIFVKGAPEIVRDLCDPKTIPANFSQVVHGLTRQGLRILACASRHDPRLTWHASQKLTREAAERDLCFLGLLLMENRLKKETTGVIKSLRGAQIGCCMVTGDHVLTGITVSRLCGLVDPKSMLFLGEFAQDEDEVPEKQRRKSWGGDSDWDEEIEQAADEGYAENRPRVRRSGAYSANNSEQDLLKLCETANQAESSGGVDIEGTQQTKARRIVFRSLDDDDGRNFSCREMVSKMSMEGCAHWEIGITGPVFSALIRSAKLNPELEEEVHSLFARCKVFARMSPEQKQTLVEVYAEDHGYTVGMCGDGANDCGALKAAHVGLSLSDAEASIAAPFTSSTQNIRPLLTLMREGRAALVTSVSCFKFMALYSVIQFVTVIRLYQLNANMSDFQYLWIDLFVILPLAVYMSRTGPCSKLSVQRPQSRLISVSVLSSVLGQSFIATAFQIFAALWTFQISNFRCDDSCPGIKAGGVCHVIELSEMPTCCARLPLGCPTRPIGEDTEENVLSLEATSAFLFAQFQYMWVVICFNTSAPFRKSLTTNGLLFGTWVLLMSISTFLLLAPDEWIEMADEMVGSLQLQLFPRQVFKWKLFALALINFASSYLFEMCLEITCQRLELGLMSRRVTISLLVLACLTFTLGPLSAVYAFFWVTA